MKLLLAWWCLNCYEKQCLLVVHGSDLSEFNSGHLWDLLGDFSTGADTKGRPQGPWPTHLDQGALDFGRESCFFRQNFACMCPCGGHISHTSAPMEGTCTQNLPSIGALVCEICPPQGHMHAKFCLTKQDSWPKSRAPWSRWVGHGPCGRPFVSAPVSVQVTRDRNYPGMNLV